MNLKRCLIFNFFRYFKLAFNIHRTNKLTVEIINFIEKFKKNKIKIISDYIKLYGRGNFI